MFIGIHRRVNERSDRESERGLFVGERIWRSLKDSLESGKFTLRANKIGCLESLRIVSLFINYSFM